MDTPVNPPTQSAAHPPNPKGWDRVGQVLADLGISQVQSSIKTARELGYVPEQIFDLVNAYRSANGKAELGALVTRIKEGTPGRDAWTGWIEPIQKIFDRRQQAVATSHMVSQNEPTPRKLTKTEQLHKELRSEFGPAIKAMTADEFNTLCADAALNSIEIWEARGFRLLPATLARLTAALQAREVQMAESGP